MNTPLDPNSPRGSDLDPRDTPEKRYRDLDGGGEGMGAIIGVVAIAALIIIGMLYIMQPPAETPAQVGKGPTTTTTTPTPTPATPTPTPAPTPPK